MGAGPINFPGTPPFNPQSGNGDPMAALQQVIQKLAQDMQRQQTQQSNRPMSPGSPAQIGMPGQTGQLPQVNPGQTTGIPKINPNASGAVPQGIAATMPNLHRQQASQMPMNNLDVSYASPAAKKGAVAQQMMNNLMTVVNQKKQEKFEKEKTQTEYLVKTYFYLLSRNDQKGIDVLLTDPKNQKLLQKAGLDLYKMQEDQTKEKQKESATNKPKQQSAALAGLQSAISDEAGKSIGGSQSSGNGQNPGNQGGPAQAGRGLPMGQNGPRSLPVASTADERSSAMISNAREEALKNDPTLLRSMATGSSLSGEEQKQAEKIATGLGISVPEATKLSMSMDSEERKVNLQTIELFSTFAKDAAKLKQDFELANKDIISRKDIAKIQQAPEYERIKIAKKAQEDMMEYRKKLQSGKSQEAITRGAAALDNIARYYETVAGNSKNEAISADALKQAETMRKQAKEMRDSQIDSSLIGFLDDMK